MAKGSNESDALAARGTTDAAEYTLSNGRDLSEAVIEARAALWESGEWTGELVALRVGRPRLSPTEPNANISFKCPESAADLIEKAARTQGVKKSEFIREAALEKATRVLASAS